MWNNGLATRKVPMLAVRAPRLASFVRIRENVVTRKIQTDQSPFSKAAKTGTAASAPWQPSEGAPLSAPAASPHRTTAQVSHRGDAVLFTCSKLNHPGNLTTCRPV